MLTAGRLHDVLPLVAPGVEVVVPVLTVQAGEDPVQVLGVCVVLGQDRGRVRVGQHVILEVPAAAEHVVDQPAHERDVRSGPDRQVQVGHRARTGEPRVDMDQRGAAGLRLHHPLEGDRMALGHVRALDEDAVRIDQVTREVGSPAAAEAGPQTGDGRGVSNTGLILDLDRAQRREQLLD